MQKKGFRKHSFTLIEVVVAIMIVVMLASLATPLYFRYVRKAKLDTAKTQLKLLEQALMDYKLDVGKFPETSDGLQSLVENVSQNEKWDGPYLKPSVPKDPWGNDYVYVSPGEHGDFDLSSYGADGQPDGEGENADINNWE
ncbi:MAG: type II secretion system major pseudopilin GspG [Lentisphaeria bacterium]|nr:type II secretion system major pseudopilin GspG [Lentisphaeria bacterium]